MVAGKHTLFWVSLALNPRMWGHNSYNDCELLLAATFMDGIW